MPLAAQELFVRTARFEVLVADEPSERVRVFAAVTSPRLLLAFDGGWTALFDPAGESAAWSDVPVEGSALELPDTAFGRVVARGSLASAEGRVRALVPRGARRAAPWLPSEVEVRLAPPLRKALSPDELRAALPLYALRAERIDVDLESLRSAGPPRPELRLEVVFGSWCTACERFVPRVVAAEATLREALGVGVRYVGVAPTVGERKDPVVERSGVRVLPTALLWEGEREVGRLVGPDDFRRFERVLARLLASSAGD